MVVGSPTKLNLIPSGVMPVVYINQGDAGYDKEFLVYNGDSPYNVPAGVSATIRGKKADGYGVTEAAALTEGSNLVTVTITEQMVAAEGANLYELVFVDTDGLRIATINMVWAVKADALGDAVISDSDLDYATQVMDQLQSVQAFKNQLDANTDGLAAETAARIAADNTLQSNINAEAATRAAADNTLQNNINAEASTRATTDASLQSQINQLVAPSGEAPSAAEVQNARIGADGVTYSSLGDAIRTQFTNTNDDLNAYTLITLNDVPHGYGSWAGDGGINSSTSIYTMRSTVGVWMYAGDSITIADNTINFAVVFSDENGLNVTNTGWQAYGYKFTAVTDGYAKINIRKRNQGGISADEYNALPLLVKIRQNYFRKTGTHNVEKLQDGLRLSNDGKSYFNSTDFSVGTLTNGVYQASGYSFRIASPEILTYPYPLSITADEDFSFGVHYFDNNDQFVSNTTWITTITIPANQKFKIVMRYTPESAGTIGRVFGLVEVLLKHFTINTSAGYGVGIARKMAGEIGNDVLDLENGYTYYYQNNELIVSPATDVYLSTAAKIFLPEGSTISVDSGYRYKYYVWDLDGNFNIHTNSWQTTNVFTTPYDCYLLLSIAPVDDTTILTPEQMASHLHVVTALSFQDYSKISALENYSGLAGDYNYTLNGKAIKFKKTKYKVRAIPNLQSTAVADVAGTTSYQGFAVYGGVIFQLFSDNKIELIDMASKTSIGVLDITSGHGDTIDFSDEFYDAADEFPLAYITADTTPSKVYVNRITRTGCTLVRTYTFPLDKTGYYAGHCLDTLNDRIYQIGYLLNSYNLNPNGENKMVVSAWDLSVVTDEGENVFTPTFIRSFTVPFIVTSQGQTMFDNKIVIMSSDFANPDTNIYFIDIGSESICSVIADLPSTLKNVECEGVAIIETDYGYDMMIKPNSRGYYLAKFA